MDTIPLMTIIWGLDPAFRLYPDYKLRLPARRGKFVRVLHEGVELDGPVGRLEVISAYTMRSFAEHKAKLEFLTTMPQKTCLRAAEGLAAAISSLLHDFFQRLFFQLGCSTGAVFVDRLDVLELYLHKVPQLGRLRAGEKLTHHSCRIRRGLRVHPLVIDLGRDFRVARTRGFCFARFARTRPRSELITLRDIFAGAPPKDAGISTRSSVARWARLAIRKLLAKSSGCRPCNDSRAHLGGWRERIVPFHDCLARVTPLSSDSLSWRLFGDRRVVAVSVCRESMIGAAYPGLRQVIYVGVEIRR